MGKASKQRKAMALLSVTKTQPNKKQNPILTAYLQQTAIEAKQRKADLQALFAPKEFNLLPSETVLPDDYPINFGYVYIMDSVFTRSDVQVSVAEYKRKFNVKEIRRCDLFGHDGAKLGDRVKHV